jgi:hypothetical protein
MMQDNTPINFCIKHFFINCQIKKLQPIFDTFVPPCILEMDTIRNKSKVIELTFKSFQEKDHFYLEQYIISSLKQF